jgi:predicted nucleic acid-binding protein
MSPRLVYVDASALVKLVLPERDSAALVAFLMPPARMASSALGRLETLRAVRRMADAGALKDAEALFERVSLLAITDRILDRAAVLEPGVLRSLDAIHLATALSLGTDLDGLITYDDRLADAARLAGVTVYMPR